MSPLFGLVLDGSYLSESFLYCYYHEYTNKENLTLYSLAITYSYDLSIVTDSGYDIFYYYHSNKEPNPEV